MLWLIRVDNTLRSTPTTIPSCSFADGWYTDRFINQFRIEVYHKMLNYHFAFLFSFPALLGISSSFWTGPICSSVRSQRSSCRKKLFCSVGVLMGTICLVQSSPRSRHIFHARPAFFQWYNTRLHPACVIFPCSHAARPKLRALLAFFNSSLYPIQESLSWSGTNSHFREKQPTLYTGHDHTTCGEKNLSIKKAH